MRVLREARVENLPAGRVFSALALCRLVERERLREVAPRGAWASAVPKEGADAAWGLSCMSGFVSLLLAASAIAMPCRIVGCANGARNSLSSDRRGIMPDSRKTLERFTPTVDSKQRRRQVRNESTNEHSSMQENREAPAGRARRRKSPTNAGFSGLGRARVVQVCAAGVRTATCW